MARTSFLTNCTRCGYKAEASTEDAVTSENVLQIYGYEGTLPHPDLKERHRRVLFTSKHVRGPVPSTG